jgi:hypothetical protein
MRPTCKNRKTLPVLRHDQLSCALPPNKVLLPRPQSPHKLTILYSNYALQAIHLFSYSPHCSTAYLLRAINTIENA